MSVTSMLVRLIRGLSVRLISTKGSGPIRTVLLLSSNPDFDARTVHDPHGTAWNSATPVLRVV